MNKFLSVILVVIVLVIVGFGIYQTTKSKTNSDTENTNSTTQSAPQSPQPSDTTVPGAIAILFYSSSCPHCTNVDKWLTDNKVAEKVKFDRRETHNQDNSQLLSEKAKACGIADDKVGVPFLFDSVNNKCYTGENEVMDFFKSKL